MYEHVEDTRIESERDKYEEYGVLSNKFDVWPMKKIKWKIYFTGTNIIDTLNSISNLMLDTGNT